MLSCCITRAAALGAGTGVLMMELVELLGPADIGCDSGTKLDASSAPGSSVLAEGPVA